MTMDRKQLAKIAAEAVARGAKEVRVNPDVGRHVIEIPNWRPATINELTKRGNHWSAKDRKKVDRNMVMAYVLRDRTPKAIGKRRVSIHVTLAGRMQVVDPDALWKSTLDALKIAGMLVDDSPRWLEMGTVEQVKGAAKATRLILEDL